MGTLASLRARVNSLWWGLRHRGRLERELDDELAFHLDSRTADLVRGGLAPAEARRRARIELGAGEAHKDAVREARGLRLADELAADVRFALRSWRKHRALAIAVVATLTLGIGFGTAVFTLINGFFFRAYGVRDPASFVRVFVARAVAPELPDHFDVPTREDLQALEPGVASLAVLAGARLVAAPLGDDPGDIDGRLVTCNFFTMHGPVRPILGRLLAPGDCAGAARVLVLGEAFWRNRLGADPGVVGRVVSFNGRPFTVVGVAERSFSARMTQAAVWLPWTLAPEFPAGQPWQARFDITGRLRPGFSAGAVRAELEVALGSLDRLHPGRRSQLVVTDGSLWQEPRHQAGKLVIVTLLLGGLAMVVVLAAANVVILLLSRAHARRQEVAVRLALGAGRRRLMKMLLTETLLMAAVAAGLSLLVAHLLPPLLLRWLAPAPLDLPLDLDWRVWSFVAAVTLPAGLVSGLTPALEALNVDLVQSLKGRPRAGAGPGGKLPVRRRLIIGQIAVSLALLVGAALFARAYGRMPGAEVSFARQTIFAPLQAKAKDAVVSWPAVHQALAADLARVPGVEAVAFARRRPPGGARLEVITTGGQRQVVAANEVSPAFFATLRLPLLHGRGLRPGDASGGGGGDGPAGGVLPVVISRQLAQRLWPGQSPLGQALSTRDGARLEVVGVVADIVVAGESDGFSLYQPLVPGAGTASVLVRFAGDPAGAVAGTRAAIARATPALERTRVRTILQRYEQQAAEVKPAAVVALGMGVIALILAVVGVYGLVAFSARRQMKELGIRAALGAQPRDVVGALLRPVLRSVSIGLAIGLCIVLLAAPGLAASVQEMDVWDPLPYAGAALLLVAAALAAMIRPARWALRVDPALVLREE
jgi:predicted permease